MSYLLCIQSSAAVVATRMRMCNCTILRNMQCDHARAWVSSFATQQRKQAKKHCCLIFYCDQWWVVRPNVSPTCYSSRKEAIAASFVHQEFIQKLHVRRQRWSANFAKTFWTKRFQRNPHNTYIEISTESLMTPEFQRIIEVCSS